MSAGAGDQKSVSATGSSRAGPREIFPSDIPVLNELASLIGSIEMETTGRYKFKDTEKAVAEELGQVWSIVDEMPDCSLLLQGNASERVMDDISLLYDMYITHTLSNFII